MAGRQGFEPRSGGPEPPVLPLDDLPALGVILGKRGGRFKAKRGHAAKRSHKLHEASRLWFMVIRSLYLVSPKPRAASPSPFSRPMNSPSTKPGYAGNELHLMSRPKQFQAAEAAA